MISQLRNIDDNAFIANGTSSIFLQQFVIRTNTWGMSNGLINKRIVSEIRTLWNCRSSCCTVFVLIRISHPDLVLKWYGAIWFIIICRCVTVYFCSESNINVSERKILSSKVLVSRGHVFILCNSLVIFAYAKVPIAFRSLFLSKVHNIFNSL